MSQQSLKSESEQRAGSGYMRSTPDLPALNLSVRGKVEADTRAREREYKKKKKKRLPSDTVSMQFIQLNPSAYFGV